MSKVLYEALEYLNASADGHRIVEKLRHATLEAYSAFRVFNLHRSPGSYKAFEDRMVDFRLVLWQAHAKMPVLRGLLPEKPRPWQAILTLFRAIVTDEYPP